MSKEVPPEFIDSICIETFNHGSRTMLTSREVSEHILRKGFKSVLIPKSDPSKHFHQVFISEFDYLIETGAFERRWAAGSIPDWLILPVAKIPIPNCLIFE